MAQAIVPGAVFQSYAAFQAALDEYCRQNAISNVPLAFVKQTTKKLATNTFGDDSPLDQRTVDRFVYKSLGLVCVNHRSANSNKNGLFCEGRITLRFDRLRNVLLISSFVAQHSNHSNHRYSVDNTHIASRPSLENDRLNRILALINQIHDDEALKMVEDTCKVILEKWDGENNGLEIHLIEKENDALPIIKSEPQLSSTETNVAEMLPIKREMLSQELQDAHFDVNFNDNDSAVQDGNDNEMFGRFVLRKNPNDR